MTTDQETERNRRLVTDGFERFARGDIGVLRTLLHEDFVEHSPGNPSGRDAFVDFITRAPVASARLELKRVVADGPYVVMHYLMTESGGQATAVVDIWRLEDGLIVEHWDVVQPVADADQECRPR
ncbi:nuclear transport factor 2 family protein [Nonomuraea sp. SMC257]|uniref:Nuclear transport factor 2 family protein n=1 Tax=Nonomuraea montanisoli TaxID=2741721 RepID=A0A7Y6M686_9ACTN|nr:nuclear transport factor 2 family protein [Nonomuraea montanisoli]NUW35059.1 nuclear transport factor 2 family protein [Nonomuraea montanisoli]